MTSTLLRRTLTTAAATGGAAALLLSGAVGASAHVGVTPDKTSANSYALLTFAVPHGCEESNTTKVAITLPQELNDAQPTVNPNWTVEKVTEQLAEPGSWLTAAPSPRGPARSCTPPRPRWSTNSGTPWSCP